MAIVTVCSRIIILLYSVVTGTHFTMVFYKTPRHPSPTGTEYLSYVWSVRIPNSDPLRLKFHKYSRAEEPENAFQNMPLCLLGHCSVEQSEQYGREHVADERTTETTNCVRFSPSSLSRISCHSALVQILKTRSNSFAGSFV